MDIVRVDGGEWKAVKDGKAAAKRAALEWWREGGFHKMTADFPKIEYATVEPTAVTFATWLTGFEIEIEGTAYDWKDLIHVHKAGSGDTVYVLTEQPKAATYTFGNAIEDYAERIAPPEEEEPAADEVEEEPAEEAPADEVEEEAPDEAEAPADDSDPNEETEPTPDQEEVESDE